MMNKIPISTHNTKLFISVNCLEVVSAPSLHSLVWRYDPVEFETEINLLHTRLRHIPIAPQKMVGAKAQLFKGKDCRVCSSFKGSPSDRERNGQSSKIVCLWITKFLKEFGAKEGEGDYSIPYQ